VKTNNKVKNVNKSENENKNKKTPIEIADIFNEYKTELHKLNLNYDQKKVVQDIINCRTSALGGHTEECDGCGHSEQQYNSCRNRHCPKCQFSAKIKWLEARRRELLPINYFHIVFTLPSQLNTIILQNKSVCYNILFKAASEALKEAALNPKNLGAKIGFFMILHTWGQNLMEHPHLHSIVPAGGLSKDHLSWVSSNSKFFIHVEILSKIFSAKYLKYLKKAYDNGELVFYGKNEHLYDADNFKDLRIKSKEKDWVVYSKKPFGSPEHALNYLGNYTHRIAISNYRIIKLEKGKVYFHYKDYKDDSKKKVMALSALEFMRRFLLHVLPPKFMKIRHYGIFGNRYKKENLKICLELLKKKNEQEAKVEKTIKKDLTEEIKDEIQNIKINITKESTMEMMKRVLGIDIQKCPKCKIGNMIAVADIKRKRPRFRSSA
jgi:hypothetical protein